MLIDQQAIQRIPAADYHSRLALSNSGMKDLAVSPLRYWFHHINPIRPAREETAQMQFGTALHCLVLEGETVFNERYARGVDQGDFPDCLVTVEDLRDYLRDHGRKPSGTRKADLIRQVQEIDPCVPIWDVIDAEHEAATAGKRVGCKDEFDRLFAAADALRNEPEIRSILRSGESEVSLFAEDPDTGVPLKGRLDWLSDDCILDVKTFKQKYGKSIDQSIADTIWYEGYARQAYLYSTLQKWVTGRSKPIRFVFAFVESDPPHEVRLKELRPSCYSGPNLYWERSRIEVRHFCGVWAEHMNRYGEKPWRTEQKAEPLLDEEIRQLAY
jgi:hypothetical protein